MENESLVERKLNFFQKIRKNRYLKNLNVERARKYRELPDYLKSDKDIIDAIINLGDNWINVFSFEIQKNLVKEKNKRLECINNLQNSVKILNEDPSIVCNLENYDNQLYNFLYESKFESNRDFVKYLTIEKQIKILTDKNLEYEVLRSADEQIEINSISKTKKIWRNRTNEFLDKFSPEAFVKIAIEDEKENRNPNNYRRVDRLIDYDLKKLSIDTQVKLLLISDKYLEKVSDDAKIKYVGKNPLLFDKLPYKVLDKMLEEDPSLFSKMPHKYQNEKIKYDKKLIKSTSTSYEFDVKLFDTPEEVKRYLMRSGFIDTKYLTYNRITDKRNDDFIWEMGKFNPSSIELLTMFGMNQTIRNSKLIQSFTKRVKEGSGEGVLTQYLEDKERFIPVSKEDVDEANRIGKIIVNEDMLRALSQEEILDYAKTPSNEKLANIIRKTYGDKAAQIIIDRPEITSELIPNYYIFSPQIIETFGIGAVHSNLTFEMKSAGVLSELARKPEKMKKYKIFSEATRDMFNKSAIDLENSLLNFYLLEDLMDEVDFSNLTENQKQNLQMLMMDRTGHRDIDIIDIPKNSEELETYIERRNKIYDDAIKKENNIEKLKDYISRRFFGLNYNLDHIQVLSDPSLKGMCRFYNLKNFVNNPKTLESHKFSEDDLDLLEMLTIINEIEDLRVLKDLAKELSLQENIVNPVFFKDLKERVPLLYNKEMISSLMTPEKTEEMEKQGTEGIKTKVDEETGIKIVSFEGADFKMYITNPFLYNSGVTMVTQDIEAMETWKNFENGIATFSGCLIDQGEITSTLESSKIGFGFFDIRPEQIVGMGITDIHVSHAKRELLTTTSEALALNYDYPEKFMWKTTDRLEFDDPYNDSMHNYNEVASLRTSKDISRIEEKTYGGKIMPDYVVILGKVTPELMQRVHSMGIKYIFEIDREKYIGKSWKRINNKEPEPIPRPETERMKKIKEIASQEER